MEYDGTMRKLIGAVSCLAIFLIFSGYVFLNARLKDNYGDMVLLVLLFLALPRLAAFRLDEYGRFFIALFWSFLALTLASVLFPPSQYANLTWLVIALYRLLFAAMIVFAALNVSDMDRVVLRWGLAAACLTLAVLYVLQKQGLAVQETLNVLSPFRVDQSKWHDKNYAFWQLLLMWGSISLLWRRNTFCTVTALLVLAASVTAIVLSSSESSMLALAVSLMVFLLVGVMPSRARSLLCFGLVMGAVLVPVAWVSLAPVRQLLEPVLPQVQAVTSRVELFDYTAGLIRKELVLGYGFGSTLFMPIPKGEVGWQFCFPGGHTHNLVLQFFMDHGLLGLLFITAVLWLLFLYLRRAMEDSPQAPAVWALVIAGLVLFSLSYSIWKADIVLMYCMWLALVFAVSSRQGRPVASWLARPRAAALFVFLGTAALACYAVDYLYLAGR